MSLNFKIKIESWIERRIVSLFLCTWIIFIMNDYQSSINIGDIQVLEEVLVSALAQ